MQSFFRSSSSETSESVRSEIIHPLLQPQITSIPPLSWQDRLPTATSLQESYDALPRLNSMGPASVHASITQGPDAGETDLLISRGLPTPPYPSPPTHTYSYEYPSYGIPRPYSAESLEQRPLRQSPYPRNPRPRWLPSSTSSQSPSSHSTTDNGAKLVGQDYFWNHPESNLSPWSSFQPPYNIADHDAFVDGYETDIEGKQSGPPYAQLIYQALMAAPGHQMVLKDIYDWMSKNTDKAQNPKFKGWQNSVRHNLSMNGAFVKIAHTDPNDKSKKGYIWALHESAIGKGVESTTRYRQKHSQKRSEQQQFRDPKRQRSGRKGGKATRGSRKSIRKHEPRSNYIGENDAADGFRMGLEVAAKPMEESWALGMNSTMGSSVPYWLHTPPLSVRSSLPDHLLYSYGDTNGYTQTQASSSPFYSSLDASSGYNSMDETCQTISSCDSGYESGYDVSYMGDELAGLT